MTFIEHFFRENSDEKSKWIPKHTLDVWIVAHVPAMIRTLLNCFSASTGEKVLTSRQKCAPNFFHSNAHPGNEVVASGVFVIIYSPLSLPFPPVVLEGISARLFSLTKTKKKQRECESMSKTTRGKANESDEYIIHYVIINTGAITISFLNVG